MKTMISRCLKISSVFLFILTIIMVSSSIAQETKQIAREVTADSIISEMDRAFTVILKNYKPQNSDKDSFYQSVCKADDSLALLKSALDRDEKTLGERIGNMESSVAELRVCYRYTDIQNDDIKVAVGSITNGWDSFYGHYIESLSGKNISLTAQQQSQMAELKNKSAELDNKLKDLESKIQDNKQLVQEIKEMREENNRVQSSDSSLMGLMAAASIFNAMRGWWWGLSTNVTYYYPGYSVWFSGYDPFWNNIYINTSPVYDTYFINTTPAYWDNTWYCDRPISIDDRSVLLTSGNDVMILDQSGPVFTDTIKDSGAWQIPDNVNIYIPDNTNDIYIIDNSD